jgi:hypothetical protein
VKDVVVDSFYIVELDLVFVAVGAAGRLGDPEGHPASLAMPQPARIQPRPIAMFKPEAGIDAFGGHVFSVADQVRGVLSDPAIAWCRRCFLLGKSAATEFCHALLLNRRGES